MLMEIDREWAVGPREAMHRGAHMGGGHPRWETEWVGGVSNARVENMRLHACLTGLTTKVPEKPVGVDEGRVIKTCPGTG